MPLAERVCPVKGKLRLPALTISQIGPPSASNLQCAALHCIVPNINMCATQHHRPSPNPIDQSSDNRIILHWPGKRLQVEAARPAAQQFELFRPHTGSAVSTRVESSEAGLLLYGDNFDALSWLLGNGYGGRVRLVYMDPPYNSNRNYTSRVRLRGKGQPALGERAVYQDIWQPGAYLQFLADRLLLLRELLQADGTLWLHCDHRMQAHLLLLLEEIFGAKCHLNTVFWRSQTMRGAKVHARYFPRSAQAIHIFRSQPQGRPVWNAPKRELVLTEAEADARYMRDEHGFFRTSDPGTYSFERLAALCAEGRLYAPYSGQVVVDENAQRVYASRGGNVGVKYHLTQRGSNRYVVTQAVDNLWDDIPGLGTVPGEDENYPTQKTERLLQRVLETATRPGDLVLDPFVGSGTTVAVAQKLRRGWIGCDSNWRAVRTAAGRLSRISQVAQTVRSSEEDFTEEKDSWAEDSSLSGEGYQILRVGEGDSVDGRRSLSEPKTSPAVDVLLSWDNDCLSVGIERFHSPLLARLAAEAKVSLPRDWRTQVRAVLIDPDYDGSVLRPSMVDAPAGRHALVAGVYALPQAGRLGQQAGSHAVERNIAVLIVDVAGEEHMILTSTWRRGR